MYQTRWKFEETGRFLKQSYNLEDVRVRSYAAHGKIQVLVHAVVYLVSTVMGTKARLELSFKKLCEKDKRFCAAADAINRLLFASRSGPEVSSLQAISLQLLFGFARPPT